MKNINDLNEHLFAQLERLSDPEATQSDIQKEYTRSRALVDVSRMVIDSGKLMLDAEKVQNDKYNADSPPHRFFDVEQERSVIEE